jgi:hypothetical protein
MKKPVLYLETSIFGFYFDEEPRNAYRKEAVVTLFNQIIFDKFKALVSPLTIRELSKAPSPYKEEFLNLIKEMKAEETKIDESEVETLAQKYVDEKVIPAEVQDDARHVAFATVSNVDVLVSLNLAHIANEWVIRKINSINLKEGYTTLNIRTPEEVIEYED